MYGRFGDYDEGNEIIIFIELKYMYIDCIFYSCVPSNIHFNRFDSFLDTQK